MPRWVSKICPKMPYTEMCPYVGMASKGWGIPAIRVLAREPPFVAIAKRARRDQRTAVKYLERHEISFQKKSNS